MDLSALCLASKSVSESQTAFSLYYGWIQCQFATNWNHLSREPQLKWPDCLDCFGKLQQLLVAAQMKKVFQKEDRLTPCWTGVPSCCWVIGGLSCFFAHIRTSVFELPFWSRDHRLSGTFLAVRIRLGLLRNPTCLVLSTPTERPLVWKVLILIHLFFTLVLLL